MNYTDYIFLPVLMLFLLLYFVTPGKYRWIVLLLASGLFYCTYGVEMLPFAAVSIIVAWAGACRMQTCYDRTEQNIGGNMSADEKRTLRSRAKTRCKRILWLCVLVIMGLLIYTKTQRLWAEIPALSGLLQDSLIVPLGISYYTMSLVGYLADVYWRKEKAEKNPLRLALFALYFPKILEGPISRHRNLASQLAEGTGFDYTRFCHGLQRVLWGFFKKLCIADRLNLFVSTVFDNCSTNYGSVLLVGTFFGAFQLYCDFSGCMDIGLGISEILGIRMEENFQQPFLSESAPEFWRRWHITLGTWFKDYIYMPIVVSPRLIKISGKVKALCGKRAAKAVMSVVPLAVVWLLTGLWHGTGWNYVLWGIWWGLLMILGTVFEPEIRKLTKWLHINTETSGFRAFRRMRTFGLFLVSRIITLSGTPQALGEVISNLLYRFGAWKLVDKSLYGYGLDRPNFWLALWLIVFLCIVERKQASRTVFREKIDSLALVWRWCIYLGGIFFVLIFGIYGAGYDASSFVYMNY